MSKPSRQDERLLALLLENQLITENQKSRLLKAIKGKTTLAEAISRVPSWTP